MKRKAFTLIELLVVIAIIALLLSIVMPGLNMAKKKAASIACMSNTRQMSMAWYMYAGENDDRIMGANMEDVGTETNCKETWIGQPHTASDTTSSSLVINTATPQVTDADEIRGAEKGKLFPYMDSPDVYHCPADKLRIGKDGTKLYVTYSVAACLNGSIDYQIKKLSNITSPGTRYNFLENGESGRNWNANGKWQMPTPAKYSGWGLWVPVAINHGDSSTFGFTDGHAEVKKWHDQVIFDQYEKGFKPGFTTYGRVYDPGSQDIAWLARGWAHRP
jgi:prepilin-type N-terminal cleavage/methylation domain-containing protein/prepilin-type processing-associated H-X9-DG protein